MPTFLAHSNNIGWPAGRKPGVPPPNHPGLRTGQLRFSAVCNYVPNSTAAFYSLFPKPIKATNTGTVRSQFHPIIGPCAGPSASGGTNGFNFSTVSSATDLIVTFGVILIVSPALAEGRIVTNGTSTNYAGLTVRSTPFSFGLQNGQFGSTVQSGIVPTVNVPYFVGASMNGVNSLFVVRNLNTGQIQTASTSTVTFGAPNGTASIANGANSLNGLVAAAMYSTAGLKISDLVEWAQDPWSFWYPRSQYDIIFESLSTPPPSVLPAGAQQYDLPPGQIPWRPLVGQSYTRGYAAYPALNQYDWPVPTPPSRLDQNYSQFFNPTQMQTGKKPFAQTDWPVPFQPFRPQVTSDQGSDTFLTATVTVPRNQYDWPLPVPAFRPQISADQSMSIWQQLFVRSPITGPTQDLPIPPFRPEVSAYQSPQVWQLNAIKGPITGPTQDLPIPPFRPQFSADQSMWIPRQLANRSPITGPTQDLPIPPYRPQVSADQGMSIWQQILNRSPITGPTQDLPIPPFRPQVSFDWSSRAPFANPFNQYDWPLPIQPADQRRGEWNRSWDIGSTQWQAFGQKPFSQTDWPNPTPFFRPQVSFDAIPSTFLTITVTVPRNQYDWPLPLLAGQFNRSFDLGSTQWLNQGQKPFLQTDWPLPIPPFRPDVTFLSASPVWLKAVLFPFNQYDWPLPVPLYRPMYGATYARRFIPGGRPFFQTDWPFPTAPFRPQFTWDLGTPAPYRVTAVRPPIAQLDWPLPIQPARLQYGVSYARRFIPGGQPFAQLDWPLPTQPFRPDFNYDSRGRPAPFVPPVPHNQYDWPLPIQPFRPDFSSQFFYVLSENPNPFNQYDWPLPIPPFRPQFSSEQVLANRLGSGQKPFAQTDWPVPSFWVPFRPQVSYEQSVARWLTSGTKPFAQTDWPLPIPPQRGTMLVYDMTTGNPNVNPPTPSTVKIEWLIRARRRGRR